MSKFNFGDEVHCLSSGVKGVIVSVTKQLHGMDRCGIQPQSLDGQKLLEGIEVDECALKMLQKGKVPLPEHRDRPQHDLDLGDEVKDPVTGLKGVITSITEFMNGCIYARVRGKLNKEGKAPTDFLHVHRWERLGPKKKQPEVRSKSGGPITRLERA